MVLQRMDAELDRLGVLSAASMLENSAESPTRLSTEAATLPISIVRRTISD